MLVVIKEGFIGDISRETISSWLKQTILLAWEKSDSESQQLCQIKAHDVCLMTASLAFKGGVFVHDFECMLPETIIFLPISDSCPLLARGQFLKLVPTLCYFISIGSYLYLYFCMHLHVCLHTVCFVLHNSFTLS